jgi:hypothetical protein
MWKTEKSATPKKPRSRKAQLPPRVPNVSRIPRLDGINFDTPEILATLGITETSYSDISDSLDPPKISLELNISDQNLNLDCWAASDRALPKEIFAEAGIHKEIYELVAIYCADSEQQLSPKLFRPGLKKFQKRLDGLIEDFNPDAGANPQGPWLPRERDEINLRSALFEALDRELDRQHEEEGKMELDIATIRSVLETLQRAVEGLQAVEKGRGPDGDRSKHQLVRGLAVIFEEYTGQKPKRSYDPVPVGDDAVTGKFANFVKAVNELIPEPYRIKKFDTLIRAVA